MYTSENKAVMLYCSAFSCWLCFAYERAGKPYTNDDSTVLLTSLPPCSPFRRPPSLPQAFAICRRMAPAAAPACLPISPFSGRSRRSRPARATSIRSFDSRRKATKRDTTRARGPSSSTRKTRSTTRTTCSCRRCPSRRLTACNTGNFSSISTSLIERQPYLSLDELRIYLSPTGNLIRTMPATRSSTA